jgi:hypothetical protein
MTIMIYLNEGFTGGCTQFLDPKNESNSNDVVPKTGQALLFDHLIYHAGAPLTEGVKYAIRTDVMFSQTQKVAHKKTGQYLSPPSRAPRSHCLACR